MPWCATCGGLHSARLGREAVCGEEPSLHQDARILAHGGEGRGQLQPEPAHAARGIRADRHVERREARRLHAQPALTVIPGPRSTCSCGTRFRPRSVSV